MDERKVATMHASRAKLAREHFFGGEIASEDDGAARVFVEALYDTERRRGPLAPTSREKGGDQLVERSSLFWLERQGAAARGFVDHDQVRIHIQERRAIEAGNDRRGGSRLSLDGLAFGPPPLDVGH